MNQKEDFAHNNQIQKTNFTYNQFMNINKPTILYICNINKKIMINCTKSIAGIILFSILFLFTVKCSKEKKEINDLIRMNLKGLVRQVDETKFNNYKDFQKNLNPQKSFIRFDEEGFITKRAQFLLNNQIQWSFYNYMGDSVWIKDIRETANHQEHIMNYMLYKTDDRGAQTAVTSILLDSSINYHIEMQTNSDGNATDIVYSKVKHPLYFPCRIIKKYNALGQSTEELTYNHNKSTGLCEEHPVKSIFKMNEQGDVLRQKIYIKNEKNATTNSWEYKYDSEGNWIYKLHYEGDTPKEVLIRELSYFKQTKTNQSS